MIFNMGGVLGATPTGTLDISANGTYDVTDYASASVSVPGYTIDEIAEKAYITNTISEIYASQATFISNYAFAGFSNYTSRLRTINFPKVKSVYRSAFYGCITLNSISLPEVEAIGYDGFGSCGIQNLYLPKVQTLESCAFEWNTNLYTVDLPLVTTISYRAFDHCDRMSTISAPNVISIGISAFSDCSSLTSIDFPECIDIGQYAFNSCRMLTTVSLPKVVSISGFAFQGCSIVNITLPALQRCGQQAFAYMNKLVYAEFPIASTSFG